MFTALQRKENVFAMKIPAKSALRNEGINIYAKKEKRTRRTHENWLAAKAEGAQWTQAPPKTSGAPFK